MKNTKEEKLILLKNKHYGNIFWTDDNTDNKYEEYEILHRCISQEEMISKWQEHFPAPVKYI